MRIPLTRWRSLIVATVAVVVLLAALAPPASAHNSLESTEPTSGSVLSSPLADAPAAIRECDTFGHRPSRVDRQLECTLERARPRAWRHGS